MRQEIVDDIDQLLEILPPRVQDALRHEEDLNSLLEIVLDLGRRPQARFPSRFLDLGSEPISREELEYVIENVGEFGDDNRAGIERTLHRISAIRNRRGDIVGLTCRIGRAVYGTIEIIRDVVETGKSLLLLGRPGVGKTTLLREVARVLSDEFQKRVVIVDTSNEIAGDGDIPHPGIGSARRMQVARVVQQAQVMIEAVENHMPQVVIIDEIGNEMEAAAARTIAERGVTLIGTAHGISLENLIVNPTLSDLIGGIGAVTLGDEEARRRGTQKTVLERKAPPTFEMIVEIQDKDRFAIHHDVAETVDSFLRGFLPQPQIRQRAGDGSWQIVAQAKQEPEPSPYVHEDISPEPERQIGKLNLFSYAVSRNRLEQAIVDLNLPVNLVENLDQADLVLTLRGQYRKMPKRLREAERRGMRVYTIRSNTYVQVKRFLEDLFNRRTEGKALVEAEEAAQKVLAQGQAVELSPQNSYLRMLQHNLAERYQLSSQSRGEEPQRYVVFYPKGGEFY
jgi:stage III sporulation protein SpoIIIAA